MAFMVVDVDGWMLMFATAKFALRLCIDGFGQCLVVGDVGFVCDDFVLERVMLS